MRFEEDKDRETYYKTVIGVLGALSIMFAIGISLAIFKIWYGLW